MLVRPFGEQLTKLQPGMIDHPVQTDNPATHIRAQVLIKQNIFWGM